MSWLNQVKQEKLVELLPEYARALLRFYTLLPGRRLLPPKVRLFLDALDSNGIAVERGP